MLIRDATEKDYESTLKLINNSLDNLENKNISKDISKVIKEYYSNDAMEHMNKIFLCTDNEEIIGCLAIEKENICKMLYVKRTYKGTIAAIELTNHVKKYLKNNGFEKFEAYVLKSTKNFAIKMGGQEQNTTINKIGNISFKTYHMIFPT